MTEPIFPAPPSFTLPVSNFGDIDVTFNLKQPGSSPVVYVDFPSNYTVDLVIGKPGAEVVRQSATITGHTAHVNIPAETANAVRDGTFWACIVHIDNGGTIVDIPAMNGTVGRYDGA